VLVVKDASFVFSINSQISTGIYNKHMPPFVTDTRRTARGLQYRFNVDRTHVNQHALSNESACANQF
jgi:hypothetical protein